MENKFKEIRMEKPGARLEEITVGKILLFPDYNSPEFDETKTRKELVIKVDEEKIRTLRKFDKINYLYGADKDEVLKLGYEFKYFIPEFGGFDRSMLPKHIDPQELFEINGESKNAYEWASETGL